MKTSCPACGAPVVGREWVEKYAFIETYACRARYRWGERAEKLSGCVVVLSASGNAWATIVWGGK